MTDHAARTPVASPSRSLRAGWRALARRPVLQVIAITVLAFAGSAAVSLVFGVPEAMVHDEFSNLLQADTFARGRLTNPQHPHWPHFESFHVVHEPTYASKYPPAQGLMLGVGLALAGHAIVGVWLSVAFMCAATTWMLQGWVPRRWALIGGVLTLLQYGLAGDWAQSYYGGALAAGGGALVFGALRRVVARARTRDAIVLAIGLLLLANTRPWEGLLTSLPIAVVLGVWFVRAGGPTFPRRCARVAAPAAVVLALGAALMGAHNHAVTGSALRLPYQVHNETYDIAPLFLWQTPRPTPDYRHEELRTLQVDHSMAIFEQQQTPDGYLRWLGLKLGRWWMWFISPPLLIPALASIAVIRRRRWAAFAAGTVLVLVTSSAATTFFFPYNAAPITSLTIYLVVDGLRGLAARRWSLPWLGRAITPVVVVFCVLSSSLGLAAHVARHGDPASWPHRRRAHERTLADTGGRHLVLVRYGPGHSVYEEWVYNSGAIDEQAVVWARDMGDDANARLLAHYADRAHWLLVVNADDEELTAVP